VTPAIVALGSNIAPRRDTILSGVAALAHLPDTRLLATSALRETDPVDTPAGSGPFVNGACLLETTLAPRALLEGLLAIEQAHGRVRGERNGPRTLDLDLIVHGANVVDEPDLTLPHPRAHDRLFVMEPAADLAPDLVHPVLGRSLSELRDALRAATP
jgi:2-amino-4-hydroxy-6-hydroxymethyldihydropteridine diphosphokinase